MFLSYFFPILTFYIFLDINWFFKVQWKLLSKMVFKDYGNIFHSGNPFCSFLKPECLQNFVRMLSRCKNNICLFLSAKLWISNLGSSEVKRKYYWLIIMPLGKAWKRKPKIEIVLWQLLSLFLLFFSLSHTLFLTPYLIFYSLKHSILSQLLFHILISSIIPSICLPIDRFSVSL